MHYTLLAHFRLESLKLLIQDRVTSVELRLTKQQKMLQWNVGASNSCPTRRTGGQQWSMWANLAVQVGAGSGAHTQQQHGLNSLLPRHSKPTSGVSGHLETTGVYSYKFHWKGIKISILGVDHLVHSDSFPLPGRLMLRDGFGPGRLPVPSLD